MLNVLLKLNHVFFYHNAAYYCGILLWRFIWIDLAHAHTMLWISLYALINNVLSLCMIMAVIALLVGRSQSFATLHPVLSMSSTRASNSQKPKFCQMCPPYLPISGISPPLQVNFSCATFKTFKIIKHVLCSYFSSRGSIKCFIVFLCLMASQFD